MPAVPDLITVSGREDLPLSDRIDLLRADLMRQPFYGIEEIRFVSAAIHDLKATIGWVRDLIGLYDQHRAKGIDAEALTPSQKTYVSPIECVVLAWFRGSHNEYVRVRNAQRALSRVDRTEGSKVP